MNNFMSNLELLMLKNIETLNDSMNYISKNLMNEVENSIENSEIYFDCEWPEFDYGKVVEPGTLITITKDRSFTAAMKNKNSFDKIAVLNFANAFHPGGGVKRGCTAQEESLCRISTLYPVISSDELSDFYIYNADNVDDRGTDSLIYSKGVVIFKSDTEEPELLPKEEQMKVDVITMAAPDLRNMMMTNIELYSIHFKRAMHMLSCAAAEEVDILILGALGCGAFENDSRVVAKAWRDSIKTFPKVFKKIEFAIYGSNVNYWDFVNQFGGTEVTYED